ncbi:MAG: hypothetical protein JRE13_09925, partial [Deltaproteobacteria bacterium]|nr:hypothetical protein [Deltaproteobacteria bacterium]
MLERPKESLRIAKRGLRAREIAAVSIGTILTFLLQPATYDIVDSNRAGLDLFSARHP